MRELLVAPALELAAKVRRREVSPRELVDLHLRRIEEVNGTLNAVVALCAERARDEARRAEERLARGGDLPPLLGVPFTVKEMAGLEGCPHTAGSWHRRAAICKRDGTAVKRLRDAGAIALGVTNQPEMGLWVESDNVVYGRARNPWDPKRSPGGSSGGEGAIIAAGGSPFGVGSDAGGSIRLPSFYCGIAGHKPTSAVVPLTGHFPFCIDDPHPMHGPPPRQVVVGPMARSARDLLPLLKIMAGPDGVDPYVHGDVRIGDANVDFRGRKVLVLEDPVFRMASRTDPAIAAEVLRAADVLSSRGARVQPWSHPLLVDALAMWRACFAEGREGQSGTDAFAYGHAFQLGREIARHVVGRPRHAVSTVAFVAFERLMPKPRGTGNTARGRAKALRVALEEALGPNGVLVMPPQPRVAPRHHGTMLRPFDWAFTALFNALELPVSAVRTGFSAEGLPLGVQIAARRKADHVAIAAAVAIEDAIGGFRLAEPTRARMHAPMQTHARG